MILCRRNLTIDPPAIEHGGGGKDQVFLLQVVTFTLKNADLLFVSTKMREESYLC